MYIVKTPLFTKTKKDPSQFKDFTMGSYVELDIEPTELEKLLESGHIVLINESEFVGAEDNNTGEDDQDSIQINVDEIDSDLMGTLDEGDIVVLVENEELTVEPEAKKSKTKAN